MQFTYVFDISKYTDLEEACEYLYDELWGEDDITGNGEKGYATKVDYEKYLCHNWDALIDAIENFDIGADQIIEVLKKNNVEAILEYCDTLIRLNTLGIAITIALNNLVR